MMTSSSFLQFPTFTPFLSHLSVNPRGIKTPTNNFNPTNYYKPSLFCRRQNFL